MRYILYEIKKHVSFRETWVAYALGIGYLIANMWNSSDFTGNVQQAWYVWHQHIWLFGANLAMFLVIIGMSRIMSYERERRTDSVLLTTARGRNKLFFSKIGFAAIYAAVIVVVLGITTFIYQFGILGFEGVFDSLKGSTYFWIDGEAAITNIGFGVLRHCLFYLSVLYLTYLVMLISQLTKRPVVTICICGAAYVFPVAYYVLGFDFLSDRLEAVAEFISRCSFGGFMMLESYSWGRTRDFYYDDWIGNLWKPVLFVVTAILVELTLLWALWRRKERK